jgi:hypothetical protein
LALRRLSLRADLLEQRSQSAGLPFKFLMQADFLLFLRSSVSSLKASTQQWWPDTLLYAGRHNGPFEIFARSQSAAYFEKIMPMIGVSSKQELLEVFSKFSLEGNTPLYIPRWEMNYLELGALSGVNELASRS